MQSCGSDQGSHVRYSRMLKPDTGHCDIGDWLHTPVINNAIDVGVSVVFFFIFIFFIVFFFFILLLHLLLLNRLLFTRKRACPQTRVHTNKRASPLTIQYWETQCEAWVWSVTVKCDCEVWSVKCEEWVWVWSVKCEAWVWAFHAALSIISHNYVVLLLLRYALFTPIMFV